MEPEDPWASTFVHADEPEPGRWLAHVDDAWTLAMAPLGGITAAVAARAMTAELGRAHPETDGQQLRSLHCLFTAPVRSGPTEADVCILRAGRSMSQAQVTVHEPGAPAGLTALGAFGGPRPGFRFTGLTPPVVAPPEQCRSFRDPLPEGVAWEPGRRMPMWDELIEGRGALGNPPWEPPTGRAEAATWMRLDHEPAPGPEGCLDPLVLLPFADLMLGSIGQVVGSDHAWFGPSVDLTIHLFAAPRPGWVLNHNHAHLAGDGYGSVQSALWSPGPDGALQLVAYATQQMFFSFPEGTPPAHALVF